MLLAFLTVSQQRAIGDGIYLPERAIQKLPEIPSQQAVIAWRAGVETLVIASELNSQAQSLGWLIPLPALPTSIDKADAGGLKTLQICIQPEITHDLSRATTRLCVGAVLVVLIGWAIAFQSRRLANVVAVLVLLLLFYAMLFTTLGVPVRVNASTGLVVQKTARVGAYDISIVHAAKPGELNDWLTANQFAPLPSSSDAAVTQYIRDKWVFAAIKLRREQAGRNTPHPLKMQFPSPQAVYPMKLTALAGTTPQFDLFIVGEERARLASLPVTFCDRFHRENHVLDVGLNPETVQCFAAKASDLKIGHPDICSLLWDGCVLTRVSGKLAPSQMRNDLSIGWEAFRPSRLHVFSPKGARSVASMVAMTVLGLYLVASAMIYARPSSDGGGFFEYAKQHGIRAISLSLVIAAVVYLVLPKLPASQINAYRGSMLRSQYLVIPSVIDLAFIEYPDLLHSNESAIASAVISMLANVHNPINLFTGSAHEMESIPGNFTVRKENEKIIFTVYDMIGSPMRFEPRIQP